MQAMGYNLVFHQARFHKKWIITHLTIESRIELHDFAKWYNLQSLILLLDVLQVWNSVSCSA